MTAPALAGATTGIGDDSHVTRIRRPAWALGLLSIVSIAGIAGFTALGVWQLHRLTWKLDLVARVEQRVHAAPVPLLARTAWPQVSDANDSYRRVSASGRFLHDRETLVQAVTDEGPGYWVVTPLKMDDGIVVLINRGFIPPNRRDPATRAAGNPPGPVQVTGLMRMTEPKGGFLRTNDPAADRWYSRDVAAIAAARNLQDVAPFFVDADTMSVPGGWPKGGMTKISFDNNHLVYAVTWFTLALMLAGASVMVAREEWQKLRKKPDIRIS